MRSDFSLNSIYHGICPQPFYFFYLPICEVGATERGCSGSIGSDDTRGYGAGSGDVGKELPRGMIP